MISKKFRTAVKLSNRRAYQIAWAAGVHPNFLSKIINGIERVKPGDPRVIRIGKVLGLSEDELFEGDPAKR
jgi:plasmid maintenance system antidote protein VapI